MTFWMIVIAIFAGIAAEALNYLVIRIAVDHATDGRHS